MLRNKKKTTPLRGRAEPLAMREAQGLLRARGKRITGQRTLLLDIIAHSEKHLDAEELYRRAQARDPHINLATVYRTLNLLVESGLIAQNHLTHDQRRVQFEYKPSVEHYHFTCVACGEIIEFESSLVQQLRAELEAKFGVEFTRDVISFEGYCARCAKKRA